MSEGEDDDPRAAARAEREQSPAERPEQALARATGHARAALAHALHALEALLDAAALATSGEPAESRRLLGPLARTLAGLASDLEAHEGSRPLLAALADALDAEIARWELRARDDADARAVLRAFLGLRELLWEFGVRRPQGAEPERPAGAPPRPRRARRARPRVQRVRVEG